MISAVSSRNFVPLERYGRPNKCPQITQTNKKMCSKMYVLLSFFWWAMLLPSCLLPTALEITAGQRQELELERQNAIFYCSL